MDRADRASVTPISDEDVDSVAEFLHREMSDRVPQSAWAAAMRAPWQRHPPNHGFQLRVRDEVVGAYLALYSDREIDGRVERFCNLAAWCVREDYRFKGLGLAHALLAQQGYHFVDLSPSGNVIALNERLGFRHLDTATAVVPNLPWPTMPGRGRVVVDDARIEARLDGRARSIFLDHRGSGAARHLLLERDGRACLVMYRRVRRKELPLFAAILYVSDPDLFAQMWRYVARHLVLRHAIPVTLVERRIAGTTPVPSFPLASPRPKMFRSSDLDADQIDDVYSELTAVPW